MYMIIIRQYYIYTNKLSKLWDGSKDDRKSIKLKVDFILPQEQPNSNNASKNTTDNTPSRKTISENVETVRSKLAFNGNAYYICID